MELVGLALAIPAVIAANVVYVLVVRFLIARFTTLRRWLLWPSYVVVALALLDVCLVLTLGAVATRTRIGPVFWYVHSLVFVFGAPSLVNALMLRGRGVWFRHWYATAVLSCFVGIFLIFFQVGVGDALFGPDGAGGPFSEWAPIRCVPRMAPDAISSQSGASVALLLKHRVWRSGAEDVLVV